jgi:hypothetical protein
MQEDIPIKDGLSDPFKIQLLSLAGEERLELFFSLRCFILRRPFTEVR